MKKIIVIVIIYLFLILTSCEFLFPDNNGYFKEYINHENIFTRLITVDAYSPVSSCGHEFDGSYFYFGLAECTKYEAGVMKVDLNGNVIWTTNINDEAAKIGKVSYAQRFISLKKIDNLIYVVSSDRGIPGLHHELHILDAETGKYNGIYYLNQENDCWDMLAPDSWGDYVYVVMSEHVRYDTNNNMIYDTHIYCFDKNNPSPTLIYDRVFSGVKIPLKGSFIHNGKMYLKSDQKVLIILDCEKVANPAYTNEECIIKEISIPNYSTYYATFPPNILVKDNQVITSYSGVFNQYDTTAYFICYDESNNYEIKWQTEDFTTITRQYPAFTDLLLYKDRIIFPFFSGYVGCYSFSTGQRLWITDNQLYANYVDMVPSNNESIGAIVDNRWYAQPTVSDSTIIIYDIDTGKKVGRIENVPTSISDARVCWGVGNKLYVISWTHYFYCYEITSKSRMEYIYLILIIGGGCGGIFIIGKKIIRNRRRGKRKENIKIEGQLNYIVL